VDDGSTDRTAELVERYSTKDKRIQLIRHGHLGVHRLSESYNTALVRSRGSLIAVLEGDDYWPQTKLENEVSTFNNERVVLTWGKAIEVNKESLELGIIPADAGQYLHVRRGKAVRNLFLGCYIPAVTVMCCKSALQAIGGFKQPHNLHCTDYPTWLALATLGEFKFVNAVLGYWVKHDANVSSQFRSSTAWCSCSIDAFKTLSASLREETGLTESRLIRRLQRLMDVRIIVDPEQDFTKVRFEELVRDQLERSTIHGSFSPVRLDSRKLDVQRALAHHITLRGRNLLRKHDWAAARRSLALAFEYAAPHDKLRSLFLMTCTLLRIAP
jgi:glycosyltransferase involved in cell wall biosynthesis